MLPSTLMTLARHHCLPAVQVQLVYKLANSIVTGDYDYHAQKTPLLVFIDS